MTELLAAKRVETKELRVDDVCVPREQFAEVFGGSQSAAAGAPVGIADEAPDGSPTPYGERADTATTTTPASEEEATGTPPVGQDEAPASSPASEAKHDRDEISPTTPPSADPPADNQPADPLPATGTD